MMILLVKAVAMDNGVFFCCWCWVVATGDNNDNVHLFRVFNTTNHGNFCLGNNAGG